MIRKATLEDSAAIAEIYNHYIINSHSTFELEPVAAEEMFKRIDRVLNELNLPWLVYLENDHVLGYAYATQWKARKAYRMTVETTVYLHHKEFGKGIGKKLYMGLLDELKDEGHHSIIGGISLPNDGSVALHEKLGYQKIGVFKEVGYKFDRWIDVGYWQLNFDQ